MSQANNSGQPYQSADEIEAVARQFESCAFNAGEFHHREHLTVIVWYLLKSSSIEAATARMREGLYKFLAHHAVNRQKYHETITRFWVKKVSALLAEESEERHPAEMANKVIEACNDANLIYAYYSRDLIASDAAREGWAEPDLQPLDF
ncbi:MAG TPA: hypothetical protein VF658_19920 [Pyrinomonadaceae bacterium]|jgi:hypothetical protein